MTLEELQSIMDAGPDPSDSPWSTKPHVANALSAMEHAAAVERRTLLDGHLRHYRGLRKEIEARCEADGGHVVVDARGALASFGDRLCAACHMHFPRFTPIGPCGPEEAGGPA
jgi:hypothetical protein